METKDIMKDCIEQALRIKYRLFDEMTKGESDKAKKIITDDLEKMEWDDIAISMFIERTRRALDEVLYMQKRKAEP